MKLTHIMYKTNVNCNVLKDYMSFLISQGFVEERTLGKEKRLYAVTQRGITILKYFRELRNVLPIIEEENHRPTPF
jgi:predicted transcriptional regulator